MEKLELIKNIEKRLKNIYKEDYENCYKDEILAMVESFNKNDFEKINKVSEKNVYLITYGDAIYKEGEKTLKTLKDFLDDNIEDTITDIHLLPMFEYTSDDGFSVVDYMKIDKNLGDWNEIRSLGKNYRLMYDFVANHMSKESEWFKGYLKGDEKYKDFFIKEDKNFDITNVIRPRTSPLYHNYEADGSLKSAWTTFSEDQVDLNFKSFNVLLEMTRIIINYAKEGASSIRLDAIGFLWKESKTTCMHLPETHEVIKLWRDILDYFKENTQIITETNVPHKENISYFGNGNDEAHMVYQFTLPPLVLYTMTTNNSTKLTKWAKGIDKISDNSTFFNFLSSHDGIGMRPTEGILTDEDREILVNKTIENGGRVSYKNNTDGSRSVYELNINYNDALINNEIDLSEELQIRKILGAHSILLSLVGVPAFYYHSLLGSRNYYKGVLDTGINRRINREKLEIDTISKNLKEDDRRKSIFNGFKDMINLRKGESAFSPYSKQQIIDISNETFALIRENKETSEKILYVLNVTPNNIEIDINYNGVNIINDKIIKGKLELNPYGFAWIRL